MEQRLLLTGAANDPGEFFYSLTSPGQVFSSDNSRLWVDDSDIVKLSIASDGTWQHELFFDGSDVGLNHWEEDIDAFTIREDGSILISTLGCAHVPGVNHIDGGDLLLFRPTSTGAHTSGSWEMYLDGSDVGLSHWENIDAVTELTDGSLVISTQRNSKLPGIGHVRDEDLSRFDPTSTGNRTRGSWSRYVDGSDISLQSSHENIDGVSVDDDGTTVAFSTTGTAWVPGLAPRDEDIFTFQATRLGSHTAGDYADSLTLNGSRAGISPHYDIDAFHASLGDSANPQPPVIDNIGNQSVDELTELTLTATASDADTPTTDLTWSLVSGPDSASIDAVTGQFSWTPAEADGPGSFEVTLAVSDGDLTDSETFLITVKEVNSAPVLGPIGNRNVNGGANVTFDADATDADLPANTLTYSLTGDIPAGSTFDAATGEFAWQTTNADSGQAYDITVTVSDGSLTDSESFTISVTSGGLQVATIPDQSVNEQETFSYQVEATGGGSTGLPNIDFETAGGQTLSAGEIITDQFASLGIHVTTDDPGDHPAMIFDSSNPTGGDLDLGTPNRQFGGPGVGNGGKSGRWKNDVARDNILIISEDGDSSDPDDNARGGVLIFTFDTPTDIDAIGLLDVDSGRNTIRFYDAAGAIISSTNIPRRGNNSAQTLDLNQADVSRMEVDFAGSGAITDLYFGDSGSGSGPLTYTLDDNAPEGMTITDSGLIEWTPTEAQGPGTFDVTVLVSDGTTTVQETFQINVAEVNVAPVIAAIDDQSVDELSLFELQVEVTDSDLPENMLTYSLANGAPNDMTISSSGLIQWTPTEAQGPNLYPVTVQVFDGTVTSTETFQITVGEVNVAPVITAIDDQSVDELSLFELQVEVTDSDLPENTLTYSLANGAPDGMTISSSGLIQWTPTEAQGPNLYPITVQVFDGTVTSTETFQITVGEVNVAPVITAIDDQPVDELSLFELQVEVTDSDLPENTLTYSLTDGAPDGMTISSSGLIQWTPTEAQGPNLYPITVQVFDGTVSSTESFEITVREVNIAPVISAIEEQIIREEESFQLQATATDEDLPENNLTFSLTGAIPAGMSITDSGLLTWTPDESQGPQTYSVTIEVTDGQTTDSETFSIVVEEANRAPVIDAIADQEAPEQTAFELQVIASDPDLPANDLSYAFLLSGAPNGMTISASGLIEWTPAEAEGPGTYSIGVEVSDGDLTDVETFTLTVTEQNTDPVLADLDNLSAFPGNRVTFDADATDSDLPANELVYSLSGDVPPEAVFNSETGLFTWDVPANAALGARTLTVTVSDQQGGFDSTTLTVTVEGPAVETITLVEDERFETTATQSITVPAGPAYFEFDILNLSFDRDSFGRVNDAFEVALLDANGKSLVHTVAPGRDSFFNVSEADQQSASANAVVDGNTVRVDLGHLAEGTAATIVYRLVNNDNRTGDDSQTTVTVTEGSVIPGDLGTPAGISVAAETATEAVDISTLTDVTGSFDINYGTTSFNNDAQTLFADIELASRANGVIDGPFVVAVDNLTDPLVSVINFDGRTPEGKPYYIVNSAAGRNTISPGASSTTASLQFLNPNATPFEYNLTVLAAPNKAPSIVSQPIVLVEAGRPYAYNVNAIDPNDGDVLTYKLLTAPGGMTIDAVSGEISWSPDTDNIGNNDVTIRVSDGRGAFDEQQFMVEVRDLVLNRPPVIISSPVTQTSLTPNAEVSTSSVLNFIELTPTDVSSSSTDVFSTFPSEDGTVFAPEFANAQSVNFDTDPFGNPIASGSFITTQYESLGLVMNNFQVSSGVFGGPASSPNATFTPAISGADLVFQFVVPVRAVGFINTSPDQDQIEFLDSEGEVIFSTRDQDDQPGPNFNVDRFLGAIADPSRPIASLRVLNNTGNLELDELIFVPIEATYEYQVEAVDPDFDPVRYQLDEAPAGMIVNATTGLISWAPGSDDVGTHTVRVTAADGRGGTATQEYQLAVQADPTNTAPVIVTDPVDSFFIPGFSNPASGDVTPQRISLDLGNGETFDGTVSITLPESAGRFADIVISVDESASMGGDQDWIPEMIPLLDNALKAEGIGAEAENPNRFAIVGGGRQNLVSYFFSQQANTKYTLYGPDNTVVADGIINEVLPDEILNLQLADDGRYVLIVEAANTADLPAGIDIGVEGEIGEGARVEQLQLNTLIVDEFLLPGQPVEYQFSLSTDTLLYFDSLTKDVYSTLNWELEGPTGVLATNRTFQNSDTSDSTPTYSAPAGEYKLTLDARFDTTSDYRFQLIDLGAGTTITSSQPVTGEFETKVETDAYRFTATAGQVFSFNNTNSGVHAGSRWRLLDAGGNVLTVQTPGVNVSNVSLPADGEYYLLMEAALFPNEGNQQLRIPSTYEFTATFEDAAPPTEIAFGETVTGTSSFAGEISEYSFTLAERAYLYLDSLTDSGLTWSLTGPAGSTGNVRFNGSDSFDNGDPVRDLVAGDYVLRVNGNVAGNFGFRLLNLADAEPVTPGTEFSGELTIPNETDMYRFSAAAGDEFYIDVTNASDTSNTLYRIYDQYGREVLEQRSLTDGPAIFEAPIDGEYTLLVEGWRANTGVDLYSFNVVPKTVTTELLTLGAVTNGSLTTPGAIAEYTFELTQDTQLYFDSLTDDSELQWTLQGPRGEEIADRRFNSSDANSVTDISIDARAGSWKLTVVGRGDATGDFEFILRDLLNDAQSTPITPAPGAANPSASISATNGINTNQSEVFRFDANAGDEFSFVTTINGTTLANYRVMDSNGIEVVPFTGLPTDRLNVVLPRTDTYYLIVETRVGRTEPTDWTIDINFVQDNTITGLGGDTFTFGETLFGSLPGAFVGDGYIFTVTERGTYYFDSLTDNSSVRWNLDGPTGQIVNNRSFTGTDSFNQSNVGLDLLPGDYRIAVYSNNGAQDYEFRFLDLSEATPITLGTSFSNTLDPGNETHTYQFAANDGDELLFDVEVTSDASNTQYKLLDPFGRRIFTSSGLRDFGPAALSFDGTYTLVVEGWRANQGPDTYTLNVKQIPAATETALTLGNTYTGSHTETGQVSDFVFTLNEYTQVHFDTLNNSAYRWNLSNEISTVVNNRSFQQSDSYDIAQTVTELLPGTYRLRVTGQDASNDFEFRLLDIANATAITPDTATTSSHPNTRSTELFRLDAQAGDIVFFQSQSVSGFTTTTPWRLIDPLGVEVAEQNINSNFGPVTLQQTGTYHLLIEGRRSDTGTNGEFTFEVISLGNELTPVAPTMLSFDEVVSSEIAKPFEQDRYAFSLTEKSLLYFDALVSDSLVNWSLENDLGRTIIANRRFTQSDSNGIVNPVLSLRPGDYVLTVQSNTVRPYEFNLQSFDGATEIISGTPFPGEFTDAQESDIYRFTGSAGQQVYVDVLSALPNAGGRIRLVDSQGQVLAVNTTLQDIEVTTLPADGDYFLLVESNVSSTSNTTYEINLVTATTTEAELNLDEILSGELVNPGDSTKYTFSLDDLSNLYFDSLTDIDTINWTLKGPQGTEISARRLNASDSFDQSNPVISNLLPGDYTLTIDAALDAVGTFSFRVFDLQTAAPVSIGDTINGDLELPNETDAYQFTASQGDVLLIDFQATADSSNTLYRVYDPIGREIIEVRNLTDFESSPLPADGTYTLLVEGWRANTGQDPYQLELAIESNRTTAIHVGDTINDSISELAELVIYTFDVSNDTFLYLDALTNNSQITWKLEGPTGEVVSPRAFTSTDSFNQTSPVIEARAGSYTLAVNGILDEVSSFSFRLLDVADATELTLPSTVGDTVAVRSGATVPTLDPANVTHTYRFTAAAGDEVSFDVVSTNVQSAIYRLIDPFGRTQFSRSIGNDLNDVLLESDGEYTLLVEGSVTATFVGTYDLQIVYNGNTPPAPITGTALTFGTNYTETLTAGSGDAYQFTVTERTLAHMDSLTDSSSIRWNLRGPRGIEVTNRSFTATDSVNSSTSTLDLRPGTYQLDIFASDGTARDYSFTLHNFEDATAVTPGTAFPTAPDNLLGRQTDLYQFDAVAGERYLIDVVSVAATNAGEFKVVDPFGRVIATSVSGVRDLDQISITIDGTYTLLVEGVRNNATPDAYELNVHRIETTDRELVSNQSNRETMAAGEEYRYTFDVTERSLFLFTPQTNTASLEWSLAGDTGSFADSRRFNQGLFPVDLPAGSYVLTVDGINGYSGDAFFTAVIADESSQLVSQEIANGQLSADSSVAVFQFNGTAGQHFALRPDFNLVFDDAQTSAITAEDLSTAFDNEDGLSGINEALRNDVFRDGAALNFIVVTDEDRDILDDQATPERIFRELSQRDALLNVIVNSRFQDENGNGVIGVDNEGNAYRADGSGGFTTTLGGVSTTNEISVREDYVNLAWALDGAAWDLNQLRVGGLTAESFTNAFVDVKVAEILEQTSLRLSASDETADVTYINPSTPVYDTIVGGQTYDFDIQIANDGNPRSFDLLFTQGQTVGSIPVYIVNPYGYSAQAVDADGDPLTWSLTEGPNGLVVDPFTGVLAWPADSVAYGEHPVTLQVSDGRGGLDEQSFMLDVNGGEAASISGVVVEGVPDGLANLNAVAVNPYSSVLDSPLNTNESFFIEDFEDGTFDLDGVSLSAGSLTSPLFPSLVDSVDGDDGNVDGSGSAGDSWYFGSGATGITITFDETELGQFPSQAGVAWTDGAGSITFQAFDGTGNLIKEFTDRVAGSGNAGEAEEDVFFGAKSANGISSLFISNSSGGIEIDHVQYSLAPLPTGLANQTVFLDQNRNGLQDAGEASTLTSADGSYSFENVESGTYTVALEPTPGFETIMPATGVYEIAVAPGDVVTGLDFGNKQVPIVNSDPLITSTPLLTIVAREDYRYQPTVSELDGDNLAFDLPLSPSGMVVNETNGTILWTPRLDQLGPQNALLRVRDGNGGIDLQFFTIDVQKPNTVPVITSTAPAGPAGINLPFTYDVNAVDTTDDVLTFQLLDAPFGATIDASTGVISWTPSAGQLGTADFDVMVTDQQGSAAQQVFSVGVELNPVNADPEILSTAPTEVWLGSTFVYAVQAVDVNGDPLTFALANAPSGMTIEANGTITWEPSPSQTGDNNVSVTVDDGRGGIATQDFTLTVATQPVNLPPQITTPPITTAVAGQAYRFEPAATDPNNDTLVWELVEGPEGMVVDPATGVLLWSPSSDDLGAETVVLRVYDSSAAFSELGYTLNVRAVNTPPVIQSTPLTSAAVGATYFYGVAAIDVDGDRLTYSLTSAPAGMTIDGATGIVSWTPQTGQEGTNAVEVMVNDGNGGVISQSFNVETAAGVSNAAPTITTAPGFFASAEELYSYDADATDPEGTAISFELLQSPSGMTIDANTGLIQWTPTASDLGTTIVRLVARDAGGAGSIQEFSLTVLPANNAPVITSSPETSVLSGGIYRYDVLATDADGEFLTYELTTAPAGMLLDGLGRIFWSPTSDQAGDFDVEVRVRDPRCGLATQAFTVSVEVDTTDPQVAVLLSSNPVNLGDSVDVRVSAIDNVGVESLTLTIDGVSVALDSTGLARVPMNSVGGFIAEATASDAAGNTATNSITIFVADPNDTDGPVLAFGSPADGSIIGGLTDVVGTVTDDSLVEYRLLLAEFGSTDFQLLATGDTNITDGVLGQIDPTLLANGTYVLRLQAFDAGGRSNAIQQTIEVTNENKLGNFRLSFTDLAIPVNGVDIVLSRTYDSLNSQTQGDFGFGWNMDFRDVQLQVSVPEASDFDKSFGFYTPYREGTRVYITLPGGEREGFTFTPVAKGLPGLVFFNPRFTADDGVTSTLTVANANLSNSFGEYYAFAGGQPYNPAAFEFGGGFTLTTKEGLVYRINADTGQVTRISDLNGNRLEFSDSGVTSSSGLSITFERDTSGRITAAIDPEGERIEYGYSEAGDLTSVTDRNGNTATLKYESDRPHYLTEVVDPLGNTGIMGEYDDDGRLVSLTDADGNSLDITTNVDNNTQAVVDALGNQTIYKYDARGNTTAVTNALGHTTVTSYDLNNNLLSETDPLGRVTSYTYDSFENILTITQPDGGVTRYTYANAQRGLIATITDALGNTRTYTYDSNGNLTGFGDSAGLSSSSTFDSQGNVLTFGNPVSGTATYDYDSFGNQTSATDAEGNVTTFTYDSDGQLVSQSWNQTINGVVETLTSTFERDSNGNITRETDALGNQTLYTYDANDRLTSETDALGRVTRFVYNTTGQLVEAIYPDSTPADLSDNPRIQMEYDDLGREISKTDELGRTTFTVYDAIGRVVEQIFPDSTPADLSDNPRMEMEYDAADQLIAMIDENGNRTEFEYDPKGNRILTRDALRNETYYDFDLQGRQTRVTDALGQETEFSYDDAGRVTMTAYADGTKVQMVYDGSGLLTSQIDQNGNTTTFEYDDRGQLSKVIEANDAETLYEYDEQGNLITLTDANGHTTSYHYDALGRRVTVERPMGETDLTEFDAVGNQISYTDFDGDRHTFVYDERDRIVRKSIVGETDVTYTYFANSLPDTVVDARGTTSYAYDFRNRLISQTDPDGAALTYTYDAVGNTLSVTTLAGTTGYAYDALNRIHKVTDATGGETEYAYDALGRRIQTDFANGTTETRIYDALSRILTINSALSGTVFDGYTYTYDAKGNRTSMMDHTGRTVNYAYDNIDRLISESVFEPGDAVVDRLTTYTFDAVGNRLTRTDTNDGLTTSTYNANDELITEINGGTTTTYAYDSNGNRTSKSDGTTTTLYEYSGENRLLSVDMDGDRTAEVRYRYDSDGNRVARTEGGSTVFYQVDSNRALAEVLVEYEAGGDIVAAYTHGDGLISQLRSGETAYYHTDALGSTTALTDGSGAVQNTYTYEAFGAVIAQTGAFENEFLFDGQRRDTTTGLDYLRARNYDAATGRFTSVDPFDGSLNAPVTLNNYIYANGNPTTFVDPSGRFSIVEFQFVQTQLIDIQKAFVSSAFEGLKRVSRVADHLLVPGTTMQNLGLAMVGSRSTKAPLGFQMYTVGAELRAAGFRAIEIALKAIYADTAKSLAKVKLTFGPVEVEVSFLKGEIEFQGQGVKKKFAKENETDKLLGRYISEMEKLLDANDLQRFIQKGTGPFEKGADRVAKIADQAISIFSDQKVNL